MLQRLELLFTKEAITKLQHASVAVVGLGGVGGFCVHALARCGIGKLILCDFDHVEESNINRQVVANYETIGQAKTVVLKEQIRQINPSCDVVLLTKKVDMELFGYEPDYIIDAIDDIPSKITLMEQCLLRNIPFISSMGAAKKWDPTAVQILPLSKTSHDPVARIIRAHFKKEHFMVVSSSEEVKVQALGSYVNVVGVFGLLLADYIIKKIIGV